MIYTHITAYNSTTICKQYIYIYIYIYMFYINAYICIHIHLPGGFNDYVFSTIFDDRNWVQPSGA